MLIRKVDHNHEESKAYTPFPVFPTDPKDHGAQDRVSIAQSYPGVFRKAPLASCRAIRGG